MLKKKEIQLLFAPFILCITWSRLSQNFMPRKLSPGQFRFLKPSRKWSLDSNMILVLIIQLKECFIT